MDDTRENLEFGGIIEGTSIYKVKTDVYVDLDNITTLEVFNEEIVGRTKYIIVMVNGYPLRMVSVRYDKLIDEWIKFKSSNLDRG